VWEAFREHEFGGSSEGDEFAAVKDVARDEADVFGEEKESQESGNVLLFVHVAGEDFEQFRVDVVEVFAEDEYKRAWFSGVVVDAVDDVHEEVVEDDFGVAAEEGEVDFEMHVAHFENEGLFVDGDEDFLLVLELGGAEVGEEEERLVVLADAAGSIEDEMWGLKVVRRGVG